jgi:hypothetical protein
VVIGSQAILGQFPDAPASMRISVEADLFPLNHPERAELIDGSIGELSPFHETFGYYAQGVAEETARLPEGWKDRFVVIQNDNTRGVKGLCLEVHDLLISKAIAGRDIVHRGPKSSVRTAALAPYGQELARRAPGQAGERLLPSHDRWRRTDLIHRSPLFRRQRNSHNENHRLRPGELAGVVA